MIKLQIPLLLVLVTGFLLGAMYLFQLLNPTLNSIQVLESNKEGTYLSPDGKKRITVYFNGGLIFFTDLSYIGVLEDLTTDSKKNLFLISPNVKEVQWINNEIIAVNGIEINIDDTYDFRYE
ncbi:DUF5412 family protein [Solibacillus sp. CAU 1738]|uniref:DUF5412 family protein n=1 Tax=Solibacillus sp. CAU 1738 TaxID=3140363 RepID=UPI00325FEE04